MRGGPAGVAPRPGSSGRQRDRWWRLIGGCLLVVGGLSVFAIGQLDFTAVRSALIAVVLTLVGVSIITIPWWLRLVRDLGDERRGRVQERERAEIAAHLHDSVLQTLALIQRQAGDAREVQRLARSQERQLRTWLYGPAGYASAGDAPAPASSSLAVSLAEAAGEVEDTYAIVRHPGDRRRRADGPAPGGAGGRRPGGHGQRRQARRGRGDQRLRRGRGRHGQRVRPGSRHRLRPGRGRRRPARPRGVDPRPDGAARRDRDGAVHAR